MKILKIHFKNINSLKGEHSIDFTQPPFTVSPLFAITGPTGSGKSTLLDVISLALFMQVPRLGKITKNEIISKGAILTRNQKEAFAAVTYECSAGTFTSTWSISTNRNGKLRDYDCELAETITGNILDLKKSEVAAKNAELIGLNYEQFIKSVLLAQGEFAQFLKAKKDERGELLEKITGTGIYRALGRKAFERNKEASKEINSQLFEIEILEKELLEEDDFKLKTKELVELEGTLKALEVDLKTLEKQATHKKEIEKRTQEIKATSESLKKQESVLADFKAHAGKPLAVHEQLQPVAEELRAYKSQQKSITELEQEKVTLDRQTEETTAKQEKLLEEVSSLVNKQLPFEELEAAVITFGNRISTFDRQLESKREAFDLIKSQIQQRSLDLNYDYNPKSEDNVARLEQLLEEKEELYTELRTHFSEEELDDVVHTKQKLSATIKTCQALSREDASRRDKIKNTEKADEELVTIHRSLHVIPETIERHTAAVKQYETELEKWELVRKNRLLQASLEEHRQRLEDNEPCPLCGSVHHPYAAHLPEIADDLEDKIKQSNSHLKESQKKLTIAQAELAVHTKDDKRLQAELEALQTAIANQTEHIEKLSSGLTKNENQSWDDLTTGFEENIQHLEALERVTKGRRDIQSLLPLIKESQEIITNGKSLGTERNELYQGINIVAEVQEVLKRHTQIVELKRNNKEAVEKNTKRQLETTLNQEALSNTLTSAAALSNFETIDLAFNSLLPASEYTQLQREFRAYQDALTASQSELTLLQKQQTMAQKIDVETSLAKLTEDIEVKVEEKTAFAKAEKELAIMIANQRADRKKIEALKAQISTAEKDIRKWRLLNELIGDATGKKFNDFAQDLTLQRLLVLANKRLIDLSDRYLLDKPNEDEDDSLVAIDAHMGGQRRSVKTLSGGETFVLSLSLALALSDLASRNVAINSLFIDEGFGTLDPETLDQTLDTLERLQSESSKMIGVISHVDSLKERITTQIQLERNGQGYSALKVV